MFLEAKPTSLLSSFAIDNNNNIIRCKIVKFESNSHRLYFHPEIRPVDFKLSSGIFSIFGQKFRLLIEG